jgi:pyridinium-3,5-biscarboxylic acid mononucleotide synthase
MYSQRAIETILKNISRKKISAQTAFKKLQNLSYETLSVARLDHHRRLRKNLPEAVYGAGKSLVQLEKITRAFLKSKQPFLITRVDGKVFRYLKRKFQKLSYSKQARIIYLKNRSPKTASVAIVTAGTSDIPVAEEARITLETVGCTATCFYDCGVSGLHRLLDQISEIEKSKIVICIAGMEGALPSVLAGLISRPVIAVPTSVGHGAHYKGVSALLTMLNSCAQGVAVVNIDSGFSAACFARLLLETSPPFQS